MATDGPDQTGEDFGTHYIQIWEEWAVLPDPSSGVDHTCRFSIDVD